MTDPQSLIRAMLDHCVTNADLSDADWRRFKDQHRMTPADTEAVLLATVQALCRVCADTAAEATRLSPALSRRG